MPNKRRTPPRIDGWLTRSSKVDRKPSPGEFALAHGVAELVEMAARQAEATERARCAELVRGLACGSELVVTVGELLRAIEGVSLEPQGAGTDGGEGAAGKGESKGGGSEVEPDGAGPSL